MTDRFAVYSGAQNSGDCSARRSAVVSFKATSTSAHP